MYYLKTNSRLSLIAKYIHPELQTKHQKHLQIGERLGSSGSLKKNRQLNRRERIRDDDEISTHSHMKLKRSLSTP
jgi:hypothetical protein